MKCKPIALTLGDYNGIGPKCIELALKNISLKNKKFYIIGDRDIFNKLNFWLPFFLWFFVCSLRQFRRVVRRFRWTAAAVATA